MIVICYFFVASMKSETKIVMVGAGDINFAKNHLRPEEVKHE